MTVLADTVHLSMSLTMPTDVPGTLGVSQMFYFSQLTMLEE